MFIYAQNRTVENQICNGNLRYYAREIGENMHAFIPVKFNAPRRKKEYYCSQRLIALDFDHDVTYEGIKSQLNDYGLPFLFSYHSLRSKPEAERFRIVFYLDCVIDNIDFTELLLRMFLYIFPEADRQCSDANHLYLGGKKLIEYHEQVLSVMQIIHVYQMCLMVISLSWSTVSKNFARSMSTIQLCPSFIISNAFRTACCAHRLGLNP